MGLVASHAPDRGNGRISEITPKGRALITRLLPIWRQAQAEMQATLSPEGFDADASAFLKRLADCLDPNTELPS